VWCRHERPGSCGSHCLMTTVEARACRAIIPDPSRPGPPRPHRPTPTRSAQVHLAGARLPRAGKDLLGEVAELAGVVEGEAAQERPDRGRRHDPVAQHAGGGAAAKPRPRRGCSPRRPACRGPGQQLGAGIGGAWPCQWREAPAASPMPSRSARVAAGSSPALATVWRSSKQPSRWSRVGGVGWRHRKGDLPGCDSGRQTPVFSPVFSQLPGPFHVQVTPPRQPHRWIQAETTSRCPPWCSLVHASLLADRVAASAGVWPRKYAATA
jgi:hypothetical protein